jgi:hypothetical protein
MYAGWHRKTVDEFFKGGAAFGLQMKQRDNNPEGFWDDSAYMMMAHVRGAAGLVCRCPSFRDTRRFQSNKMV